MKFPSIPRELWLLGALLVTEASTDGCSSSSPPSDCLNPQPHPPSYCGENPGGADSGFSGLGQGSGGTGASNSSSGAVGGGAGTGAPVASTATGGGGGSSGGAAMGASSGSGGPGTAPGSSSSSSSGGGESGADAGLELDGAVPDGAPRDGRATDDHDGHYPKDAHERDAPAPADTGSEDGHSFDAHERDAPSVSDVVTDGAPDHRDDPGDAGTEGDQ
jgi:hypothetical protein